MIKSRDYGVEILENTFSISYGFRLIFITVLYDSKLLRTQNEKF